MDAAECLFFLRLHERPGDRVILRSVTGISVAFRVAGRDVQVEARITLGRYFARDGALRLTPITRGGPFGAGAGTTETTSW